MREQKEKVCKNCAHYRRHYILHKDRATAVNYRLAGPAGDVDYLSTDFLKWVQEMVLPPVGEDHGEQG